MFLPDTTFERPKPNLKKTNRERERKRVGGL